VRDLACPVKEAKELQERHGLPSFPKIIPLGNFLGGRGAGMSTVAVDADLSRVSSAMIALVLYCKV